MEEIFSPKMEGGKVSCSGALGWASPTAGNLRAAMSLTYRQRMRGFENEENLCASPTWSVIHGIGEHDQEAKTCSLLRSCISKLKPPFFPSQFPFPSVLSEWHPSTIQPMAKHWEPFCSPCLSIISPPPISQHGLLFLPP